MSGSITSMGTTSVAIIGGGISGLVCANRLAQLGINNTTVFDTGRLAPGGRCSSRQVVVDGQMCTFDHSAQYFTVSDSRFAKIVSFLHRKGAVKEWTGKLGHLHKGVFTPEKKLTQAFVGVNGMGDIPKCLAASLNVKGASWVKTVFWEQSIRKWKVDQYGYFDYLVIAHNGKCADNLMANAGAADIHRLTQVRFCDRLLMKDKRMQLCSIWALLVCFPKSLQLSYEGVHVDHVDISWMANNTAKLGTINAGGSRECWTVFSTRQFGSQNKCPQSNIPPKVEREVTSKLLNAMKEATGLRELPTPSYTMVQLWGAAVPLNVFKSSEECIFDSHHNVGICGDWLTLPCIQGAAVSGLALAEKIHQHTTGNGKSTTLLPDFKPADGEVIGNGKSTTLLPDFKSADGEIIGAFPTDPSMIFKPQA